MGKAESDTQSSTLTVHIPSQLEECQKIEGLERFVTAFRSHFDRITVDFENLGNRVQDVKIVTLFTTVDGLAVCFSPSYGWCVAKHGLNGFSLSNFTETFQRGTWLSVNIFPSVTEDGYHSVVNWIICPKYNICAAPFKLFCSNREAELLIMEALAFNHVKQRIANGPTRFVLLDTPMGEVWLPGVVESTTDLQTDESNPLMLCPQFCLCGKRSYCQYEHSIKSANQKVLNQASAAKTNENLKCEEKEDSLVNVSNGESVYELSKHDDEKNENKPVNEEELSQSSMSTNEEPTDDDDNDPQSLNQSGISETESFEFSESDCGEEISSGDDEVISVDGQKFGNEPPDVESINGL